MIDKITRNAYVNSIQSARRKGIKEEKGEGTRLSDTAAEHVKFIDKVKAALPVHCDQNGKSAKEYWVNAVVDQYFSSTLAQSPNKREIVRRVEESLALLGLDDDQIKRLLLK